MTDSELRVAVAETLGWKCVRLFEKALRGYKPTGHPDCSSYIVPNYHGDLNACAEFEATMMDEQKEAYCRILCDALCTPEECSVYDFTDSDLIAVAFATARQRCIAFLKTVRPEGFK